MIQHQVNTSIDFVCVDNETFNLGCYILKFNSNPITSDYLICSQVQIDGHDFCLFEYTIVDLEQDDRDFEAFGEDSDSNDENNWRNEYPEDDEEEVCSDDYDEFGFCGKKL